MAPSSCYNSPFPQSCLNVLPQDQIDVIFIRFTKPLPSLHNQTILATSAISVSNTTCHISQHFLTRNSPMLSSKLIALETKMCNYILFLG